MRILCYPLSLFFLFALNVQAQQIALVNAPAPVIGESSSLAEPGSAAIMPVPAPRTAPSEKSFAAQDWVLLGAAAALRFGDYESTVKALSDPANFREVELPQALVHNKAAFGAFEASTVVANYYAYRMLVRHDHRTMARVGQYINVGLVGWTVGHNYYGIEKYWPRYSFTLANR